MSRLPRHLYLVVATLTLAACTTAPRLSRGTANLTRGPYLQQATPASVIVVWRTEGASQPRLRFGRAPDALTQTVAGDAITLRASMDVQAAASVPRLYQEPPEETPHREADHDPSTVPNTYQYEAQVTGLQPNTKYYYAVYNGDRRLAGGDANHFFVSHPPVGSAADLRIWVVGDSGTGEKEQAMVHDAMLDYVRETGRPVDHYIHVGDMAYSDGTDREFQHGFFDPYQATLRHVVCWPTMGNHEGHTSRGISGVGPYYDAYVVPTRAETGGVPSGTEAYYSFDIANIHFICLDSHDLDRSPDAAMARWLRADLEQARAQWLIAFWHHPPYSMGSHNSDREEQLIEMRENFMPILESAGVDLTLTGHSHIYERSMLMDGAYATPTTAKGVILDDGDGNPAGDGPYRKSAGLNPNEGSVSIVAGHGGAGLSREGTMPVMRQIILEHGSLLLDIKGDTLTGTMINKHGETRDLFSLVKQGKVTPTRVENPWQPVHDISQLTEMRLEFTPGQPDELPEGWALAQGAPATVTVATAPGTDRPVLRVQAGAEPVIGLYTLPWRTQAVEYATEVRLGAGTVAGAGLVFGYVDPQNFGRVLLDATAGTIRVSRLVDGRETVIEEREIALPPDQWLELEIEIGEGKVDVNYGDDTLEFPAQVGPGLTAVPLGFYVPAHAVAEFVEFVIEDESERP